MAKLPDYPFVARFDVASYYDTISHEILLIQLEELNCPGYFMEILSQYLAAPDCSGEGIGLSSGGSLSPLIAAVYLTPLDAVFENFCNTFYRRYMDDFVILAKTRRELRTAVKLVHLVLAG